MINPQYSLLQQRMTTEPDIYQNMPIDQNTYSNVPMNQNTYPDMQNNAMSPDNLLPSSVPTNNNEASLYPYENQEIPNAFQRYFAEGGEVKKTNKKTKNKKQENDNLYPLLAELVRAQGGEEDTILAHINPVEAQILGLINGNGGSINPKTGLPRFGSMPWHKNQNYWTKKGGKLALGDVITGGGAILGAMTGNPMIGGSLAGALGSKIQGKSALMGALKGAAYGTGASMLGSGLSALGSTSIGPALAGQGSLGAYNLSNLGTSAWGTAPASYNAFQAAEAGGGKTLSNMASTAATQGMSAAPMSFMDKIKNSLTDPKTLVALGGLGLQGYNVYQAGKENELNRREAKQEKNPEYIADREKRLKKAMRLSPAEFAELEAYEELEEANKKKKEAKNKINYKPVHRKQHTPAEYAQTGKWFSYYDNPNFQGASLYAKGGEASPLIEMMTKGKPQVEFEVERIESPREIGYYLEGHTGGQDDKVPAYLSDGEYVWDASTVSDVGDGNNKAGAKKLDKFRENIRKHKRGGETKMPPKAKSLIDYMR